MTAIVSVALMVTPRGSRQPTLGPLSDDFVLKGWSDHSQFVSGDREFVRPLPLLVWRLLSLLGLGYGGTHLLNVLLHGLNAGLVGLLARRLGLGVRGVVLATAMFLAWRRATTFHRVPRNV